MAERTGIVVGTNKGHVRQTLSTVANRLRTSIVISVSSNQAELGYFVMVMCESYHVYQQ